MKKLKKCPFCKRKVRWCSDNPKEPHDCDQIYCNSCKINFDSYHKTVKNASNFKQAKKAMAKLWNRRK